ncbi:MAG: ATP-binding protein [Capsulimonadaceae bacterium]
MSENDFLVERRWISHPGNVHFARAVIRDFVSNYAADVTDLIELAIGEACANAVEHGSPSGDGNYFTVRCGLSNAESLVFEVEDEGENAGIKNMPMVHTPDLESEGGRGLFLINNIMDDVSLLSSSRGLIVRMTKRLPVYS